VVGRADSTKPTKWTPSAIKQTERDKRRVLGGPYASLNDVCSGSFVSRIDGGFVQEIGVRTADSAV
jgi:hypothetical protein